MAGSGTPGRATAVATPNATEGAVLTVTGTGGDVMSPSMANMAATPGPANNCIEGVLNITTGAGTTAVVVKCRRRDATGGITGAQVGTSQTHTLAAGASANIAFEFIDPSAPTADGYTITVTQTAGTAPGTVNEIVAQVSSYL